MNKTIAASPKIAVIVQAQGDTILRITLGVSSALTLECSSPLLYSTLIPWLESYSTGKWSPFPVPLPKTPFTQKVALYLQNTPLGKVLSYGELAAAIGHPKAARAVGNFCRGNLFPLLIPCHRVVPQSKEVGKFTPDPKIKEHLLRFEGAILKKAQESVFRLRQNLRV